MLPAETKKKSEVGKPYALTETKGENKVAKIPKITNHYRKAFAERLRARRRIKYETAIEFAAALGIEKNRYGTWERAIAEPSIAMLIRICALLDCTPNDLLLGISKSGTGNGGKKRKKTVNPIPLKPGITRHIGHLKAVKG